MTIFWTTMTAYVPPDVSMCKFGCENENSALFVSVCHWKPWCNRPCLCTAISLPGGPILTARPILYSWLAVRGCDFTCGAKKSREMITLPLRIVDGRKGKCRKELWTGRPADEKNSDLISCQTRRIMFVTNGNQCARAPSLLRAF